MKSVVLYCRQSRTDDPDRSPSLDAQEAELRALADRRGWRIDRVFRDPDAPADALERRKQWVELLDHCDHHDVDVVAALDTSRLWRSVELRYVSLRQLQTAGVTTVATLGGETTTDPHNDPESGLVGTMLAAVAEFDNRLRSLKIRGAHEQAAAAGQPTYGGTRPYGYATDRITVVDAEAAVIQEAARRVLAGESVGSICNDLTARGITTVTGRPWRTTVLRRVLTAPRTAGLREHRGEIIGRAQWDEILPRATWERVRAVLLDPSRRGQGAGGGRPRAYLLTGGGAVCGPCGAALVARPKGDGRRCYVCARGGNGQGFTGCGKIRQLADPLEDEVRDRIAARLDGDGLRNALAELQADDRGGLVGDLLDAERDLEDLEVAHFTRKHLSRGGYLRARAELEGRIETLRTALSRVDHSWVLVDLLASERSLVDTWDAQQMDWRRLVVAAVIDRVTVGPAVQGRNFFDPDRVTVTWRV
jgi:DNA invertase Pin-like site-specific DNA recombinase